MSRVKSARGFSLVEVMIAGVLISAMVFGAMRAIQALSSSARLAGAANEITLLKSQIQTLIGPANVCPNGLKDASGNVAKFNPDNILPANPTPAQLASYQSENSLSEIRVGGLSLVKEGVQTGSLLIQQVNLVELDSSLRSTSNVNGVSARKIVAALDIQLDIRTSATSSGNTRRIQLPISVETDASTGASRNTILACNMGTNLSSGSTSPTPGGSVLRTSPLDGTARGSSVQTSLTAGGSCTVVANASVAAGQWMACGQGYYLAALLDAPDGSQDLFCCRMPTDGSTAINTTALQGQTASSSATTNLTSGGSCAVRTNSNYVANQWMGCDRGYYLAGILDGGASSKDAICCKYPRFDAIEALAPDTSTLNTTWKGTTATKVLEIQNQCVHLENTRYTNPHWMACPTGYSVTALSDNDQNNRDIFCCPMPSF